MNLRLGPILLHKRYLSPSLITCVHHTTGRGYSGSLTIFSYSQEGFAACGSKALSKNRREPPEAARNQASDLFRSHLYTGLTTK